MVDRREPDDVIEKFWVMPTPQQPVFAYRLGDLPESVACETIVLALPCEHRAYAVVGDAYLAAARDNPTSPAEARVGFELWVAVRRGPFWRLPVPVVLDRTMGPREVRIVFNVEYESQLYLRSLVGGARG